jgi:hypothetical protein
MSDDGYKVQLNFEDEFQDLKSKDLKNLAGKIAQRFIKIRTSKFNVSFGEAGDFRIRSNKEFKEEISKAGDAPAKLNVLETANGDHRL